MYPYLSIFKSKPDYVCTYILSLINRRVYHPASSLSLSLLVLDKCVISFWASIASVVLCGVHVPHAMPRLVLCFQVPRIVAIGQGLPCIYVLSEPIQSCTAGSLKDPDDLPGLAHFCEHMLFLGTQKVEYAYTVLDVLGLAAFMWYVVFGIPHYSIPRRMGISNL